MGKIPHDFKAMLRKRKWMNKSIKLGEIFLIVFMKIIDVALTTEDENKERNYESKIAINLRINLCKVVKKNIQKGI